MPRAVFEPTISAEERTQTYAFTRADGKTGVVVVYMEYFFLIRLLVCLWRMKHINCD